MLNPTYDNRIGLLEELPKNSICIEIGVLYGEFSSMIIEKTNPKELWLVDHIWKNPVHTKSLSMLLKNIMPHMCRSRLLIIPTRIEALVNNVDLNGYFDWVYLDTDHNYTSTKRHLKICHKIIKKNGIITGDDYVFRFKELQRAVDDFVIEYRDSIEICYLNNELPENCYQFKIRKIK